ncbi:hypothetical protein TMO_c0469 (plasmid) [Tistrella mobilis KA081020-065]|uniref:Uncharacterized protein n=1 Tax=Tistrella mobilis (strain KA081020-065) TaxID=1110502 RepID=I3TWE1_TISMK|nr:hypothetical protein TMO_c0469 [Tistrella mobilis KA081020-065]
MVEKPAQGSSHQDHMIAQRQCYPEATRFDAPVEHLGEITLLKLIRINNQ